LPRHDGAAVPRGQPNVSAVVQCLLVVGEAANHLADDTRDQLKQFPWDKIVRMGHRLVHGFFDIDLSLVWQVVDHDLQPLIEALRAWEAGRGAGGESVGA